MTCIYAKINIVPIIVLPEHIANQIAAGEVVEGPSSIIKELVENSIDAQASKIDIDVSKQLLKIQVVDNGSGISPDELSLAFKRHATSKISTIEDLHALMTNGFRGEALASIAAVSKLTCISKRKEDKHATKIYIENGKEDITMTGASNGTNIVIDDLFFNTPARLKFLKSNNKERTNIIDTVRSLAIANPAVAFSLTIDHKSNLKTSGSNNIKTVLAEIFSDEICDGLVEVSLSRGPLKVTGYSSKAYVFRSDKRGIFTIVNNRILKCYILRSAVEAVYKDILGTGKYPIAVIHLELPKEDVDVNVHPNKQEVKYHETNKIYTLVGDAVAKALSDSHYQSNKSFQPSMKDYELSQTSLADSSFNSALISNSEHYLRANKNDLNFKSSILKTVQEEVAMELVDENFNDLEPRKSYRDDFVYSSPEDRLSADARKFISRFGSVDISITLTKGLKTIINSLGNKTNFEIVINDPESNEQSVIIRGDFIGENWLKESYLAFLHSLGQDILKRELLETNFKVKANKTLSSRPQSKPNLQQLEEIWQKDHYTCVYCGKLLLHPNTVKQALSKCSDPALLNSHLASYDHHLPASKFPELNKDTRNLYACCQECNIQKSNSLASKTWTPKPVNNWDKAELKIGDIVFKRPL